MVSTFSCSKLVAFVADKSATVDQMELDVKHEQYRSRDSWTVSTNNVFEYFPESAQPYKHCRERY